MMPTILRSAGAIVVGLVVASILVVAIEFLSLTVHPLPEDFNKESLEDLREYVENCPSWVFAAAIPMWGLTAFISTWITGRLGNRASAAILGLFLLSMVLLNISMVPYPIWFKIAAPIAIALAAGYAYRPSGRPASAVAEHLETRSSNA
ncbi:MAG TPA: hypothetical protein PK400_04295 [Phycisphaerales bacterium]|nr:hypothetical protein [Phycisphaerales bacterium]HRQ74704.1 hypothetical protein [Phycisphaerales bacterium]